MQKEKNMFYYLTLLIQEEQYVALPIFRCNPTMIARVRTINSKWSCLYYVSIRPRTNGLLILLSYLGLSSFTLSCLTLKYRSSPPEVFLGKAVLKICSKFTGEHPCRSAISIKLLCFALSKWASHKIFLSNVCQKISVKFNLNTGLMEIFTENCCVYKGLKIGILQNFHIIYLMQEHLWTANFVS